MQSSETNEEAIIIDDANTESNSPIDNETTVNLNNIDDDDDDGGENSASDDDDDDDDDDDNDDNDGGSLDDGDDDNDNNEGIDSENGDNNDNINGNADGDVETNSDGRTTAGNTAAYYPLKKIDDRYRNGPYMSNNKFTAYQKLEVEDGLYYFAAKVVSDEDINDTDGNLIEHGDMLEGGLFFLVCAYSEDLDDLQFLFLKQSWFEKCPETDDFGGNYSNATGLKIPIMSYL